MEKCTWLPVAGVVLVRAQECECNHGYPKIQTREGRTDRAKVVSQQVGTIEAKSGVVDSRGGGVS
jgi:hypothetical protein